MLPCGELTGADGGYFAAGVAPTLVSIAYSQTLSLAAAKFRRTARTLHGVHGGYKLGLEARGARASSRERGVTSTRLEGASTFLARLVSKTPCVTRS